MNPTAGATPAQQALGKINSDGKIGTQYISSSNKPQGAPNIKGRKVYIDVTEFKKQGGRVVSPSELVKDLKRHAKENPHARNAVEKLIHYVRHVEGETLLEGDVDGIFV